MDVVITEGRYYYFLVPIFLWGPNLSHFGLFVLGYTFFLQSFGVIGQNQKYHLLNEDVQETYKKTSYEQIGVKNKIKMNTIILFTKTDFLN